MVEIDRIKQLSKEKGITLSFICSKLGLQRGYLKDVGNGKTALPENRLEIIADILGTTADYLHGKTDVKEKAATISGSDLTADELEFISKFRALPPEKQKALLLLAEGK